ncbi:hypothetical protein GQ457_03G020250 [Hibiscus cannabinus]
MISSTRTVGNQLGDIKTSSKSYNNIKENHPRAKIKFKSSFELICITLVTQICNFHYYSLFGLCELKIGQKYFL